MISDDLLLAWLAGALEPGRSLEIQAEVAASPDLRVRLERLRALTAEDRPLAPAWRLPPPGHGQGLPALARAAAALSRPTVTAGGRLRLSLPAGLDPQAIVLALWRGPDDWELLSPTGPDDLLRVADLPQEDDRPWLDLRVREVPRRQRFALAVAPADTVIDWSAPAATRFAALQQAMLEGRLPAMSVEVQLEGGAGAG